VSRADRRLTVVELAALTEVLMAVAQEILDEARLYLMAGDIEAAESLIHQGKTLGHASRMLIERERTLAELGLD